MFTLDPSSPLFNAAVDVVAQNPGISVGELHERLKSQAHIEVTLQHVYRLVTRLVEHRIFIKRKKSLRINLLWLSHVELFAQESKARLLEGQDLTTVASLKSGQRVQFAVRSVQEAQAMWHHILIQLNRIVPPSEERALYKYYSHAWWLLHDENDLSFYDRIAKRGIRCHWLIGNDTYLDRRAVGKVEKIFTIALTDRPPFPEEGYNLNVFGDYVMECVFPTSVADHFALLFKNTKGAKDWKPQLLDDMFHLRAPVKVTVWKSEAKAKDLKAKIDRLIPAHMRKTR